MGFKQVFELFSDCWGLYRRYAVSDLNEESLKSFVSETEELYRNKYGRDELAKEMLLAVSGEIDRIERRKNGEYRRLQKTR